ncbi:two-component system sensor histidine kinase MtrB [Ornithinimicrobium humiphilum]|uniref:Sensor histidine kinase MtrB n=1 Tax=Ornithinimicrobium humiphilum TaxID=125288 RepID=A0A543KMJ1_9MICO|nr:MtrAB system histidine kinase MtrB [Ornithinimicrobium humiphilum]TQM96254.1 two-component system sensor histidine kinase MtrB [Ornithinimicrobium humiphilum]
MTEAVRPARTGPGTRLLRWWRGSLRLRVISTTTLVGVALSALLGTVLFQQIGEGLVDQAVDNAQRDASQQVALAQEAFDSTDRRDDTGLSLAADNQMQSMAGAGGQEGRRVVLWPALDNERGAPVSGRALGANASDIPESLREALRADPTNQQVVVIPVTLAGQEQPVTAVVVGSRVSLVRAGAYDLFLVYPLLREQETLDLVRQLFVAAGAALTLLMAGVGGVATRIVTRPVEEAATVSHQLAMGHLDERLPVRGTDELAQLATSFNTMADSIQLRIRELRALSQLQQRFVSDVSHELRTPLTTIRMAGEILHASREDFPLPVARSAELLQQELDRFEELLTELLEISRYDSGAATIERHLEDVVVLVQAAVDGVRALADRYGSELVVVAPDEPVLVYMDGRRVSRVLRNLLSNAIEHGEGRPVLVAVAATEQVVGVSVHDHGIGLDEQQQAHVFDRFWRADPSRDRTTGGTGLGLAIAQEDARVHGGWLQVGSAPGQGACFRLLLPRQATYVIAEQPPAVGPPTGPDGDHEHAVPPVVLALATHGEEEP